MKGFLKVLLIVFLMIPSILFAKEEKELKMYLFYGDGCPHCKALGEFLDGYLEGVCGYGYSSYLYCMRLIYKYKKQYVCIVVRN